MGLGVGEERQAGRQSNRSLAVTLPAEIQGEESRTTPDVGSVSQRFFSWGGGEWVVLCLQAGHWNPHPSKVGVTFSGDSLARQTGAVRLELLIAVQEARIGGTSMGAGGRRGSCVGVRLT